MPEPDDKKVDDNKPNDDKKPAEDDLTPAQTKQALRYLLQQTKEQSKTIAGLNEKLEAQDNRHATPPRDDDKGEDNEVDIDALDNRGLVKYMTSQIADLITPLRQQISQSDNKLEETRASGEVEKASSTYDDFFQFKDEIEETIKANPALSVDDAYHLARAHNPAKVNALTKAAEEAATKKAEEEAPKEDAAFGGLLPTSTIGEAAQHMSAKEAGEAAWDEHMADFESVLSN